MATQTDKTASSSPTASKKTRRIKTPKYKSFSLQKRIKTVSNIPTAFRLLGTALGTLKRHWKLFAGIVGIYALLNIILVQSFSGVGNPREIKDALDEAFNGAWGQVAASVTLFAYMLGSAGNTGSPAAGAYQLMLTLIVSLALIWTLREVYAGHKVRIRDGFYRGMYPLVPFAIVLSVIGLQLLPLLGGAFLYNLVTVNEIVTTGMEQFLWGCIFFTLALTSLYMISSSVFALYIVALPGMTPLRALRSARGLVMGRRWTVMRKVIFLPIALLVLAALITVPIIMLATPFALIAFFLLTMLSLAIVQSYMYTLYRSLL